MKLLSAQGITKNAQTLGYLAGVFAGDYNAFNRLLDTVNRLIKGQIHAPDMADINDWVRRGYLTNGIMAYVAGMLIEDLKVPVIGPYGKAIQKGAMGYLIASGGAKLLYAMTHSPAPDGAGSSVSDVNYSY